MVPINTILGFTKPALLPLLSLLPWLQLSFPLAGSQQYMQFDPTGLVMQPSLIQADWHPLPETVIFPSSSVQVVCK